MIPTEILIAFGISSFFTVLFPLLLLVLLAIRRAISLCPLLIGVLAFFVSQILLRIPLLSILSTQGWFLTFAQQQMLLYLILLSASAGLFEESARLLGAKCFCKGRRSYRDAVSFGLGHGLCEVVLLVGLSSIGNLLYCVMINSGSLGAAASGSAEMLQQITAALASVSTASIYLGIVERISAVLFHVFASVLIFYGVNRRHSFRYWLFALLAHTAFNVAATFLVQYSNIWICEGVSTWDSYRSLMSGPCATPSPRKTLMHSKIAIKKQLHGSFPRSCFVYYENSFRRSIPVW